MPIYEYYCTQCQEKFEAIKGMGERKSTLCPLCNQVCKLVPSMFKIKMFTRIDQADGEGFSTRWTSNAELAEQRRGYFLGQT